MLCHSQALGWKVRSPASDQQLQVDILPESGVKMSEEMMRIQTYNSPLFIISRMVQIVPCQHTETKMPVSEKLLCMPLEESAIAARH